MLAKFTDILYNFDLIGPNPQLYIFNNNRYKTFFSFIISLTLIYLFFFKATISLLKIRESISEKMINNYFIFSFLYHFFTSSIF